MFCTKCGKQLDDGAKFCTGCGAQLGGSPSAQAQAAPVQPHLHLYNRKQYPCMHSLYNPNPCRNKHLMDTRNRNMRRHPKAVIGWLRRFLWDNTSVCFC